MSRTRSRCRLPCLVLAACLGITPHALAAERLLVLEARLNGTATGVLAEVAERDGELLAPAAELRAIGLAVPEGDGLVALRSLAGVAAQVNGLAQTLDLTAEPGALRRRRVTPAGEALPPLTRPDWSLVLNYDTLGTFTGSRTYGSVLDEVRLAGPYGTLSNTAVSRFGLETPGQAFVRLDSNWTWADPDGLRAWRLGDLVSGAVGWSRAVRLGGAQVASDFNMRPDLVRYGAPSFNGVAAVPSTVDVLVSGVRQFSSTVPVGPFELRNLPIVASGGSEVVVAVRDALGRQTLTTLPFYASTLLLAEGLTAYSAEAGQVRLGYGIRNTDYTSWAATGSARHGVRDWLTVEGHAEATDGLNLIGLGGALRFGGYGVASLALSGSAGRGATLPRDITGRYGPLGKVATGPAQGGQIAVGLQTGTLRVNASLVASVATAGYRDVAALFGTSTLRSAVRSALTLPLGRYGALSLAWIGQRGGTLAAAPFGAGTLGNQIAGLPVGTATSSSLLNLSYSVTLAEGVYAYASGFHDLRGSAGTGVLVGLTLALGAADSANLTYNRQDRSSTYTAQLQRPAVRPGELGWRLVDQEGDVSRRLGEAQYLSPWGRGTVGVDQADRQTSGRVGVGGALVLGGGSAFLSDRIYDSFAVVRTGTQADVPVLYENRPAGRTRSDGRLLVPQLRSFDSNKLAIDPLALPADVEIDRTAAQVRPGDRAGLVVDFGVRRSGGALVRFRRADGTPVPAGSVVRLPGRPEATVGRDGRAYLTGLAARNEVAIEIAGGGTCYASVAFAPAAGEIPLIGPLPCE